MFKRQSKEILAGKTRKIDLLFYHIYICDATVRLKVASENFLASVLFIDMDYYVNGENLTVSAMGQIFELTRKK